MNKWTRRVIILLLCGSSVMLGGCDGNIGVGMSVGVPVGNNGYISVGGHRRL